jgi:AI-2 transport protein TqsA
MIMRRRSSEHIENSHSGGTAATDSLTDRSGRLSPGTLTLVAAAALTVTAIGMSSIRGILAPAVLALVLVICVSPVRRYLRAKGASHGIATGAVILMTFALIGAFMITVAFAVGQFIAMLPDYQDEFDDLGRTLGNWLASVGMNQEQVEQLRADIDPHNIVSVLFGAVGGAVSITGSLVIVFTMIILMAADATYLPTISGQLRARRPHLVASIEHFAPNVRRYMVVTTALGLAQGTLNAIALWILQVPAALLWGLLAFLCSFIPNVGYFFAITPPLVFGFLVGGWPTVVIIVLVYGVINGGVQSVIQPRVVGQAVSLSQTLTFFSVLFWAIVIGPIGAILAIPLTLLGKALLVDAQPRAHIWQPVFGPTDETRELKKTEDAEYAERRAHSDRTGSQPGRGELAHDPKRRL